MVEKQTRVSQTDDFYRLTAQQFRGFRKIDIRVKNVNFVVGDNSSGKTSIIYLLELISSREFLNSTDLLEGSDNLSHPLDYFSPYFSQNLCSIGFYFGDEKQIESDSKKGKRRKKYSRGKLVTFRRRGDDGFDIRRVSVVNGKRVRHTKSQGYKFLRKEETYEEIDFVSNSDSFIHDHTHCKSGFKTDKTFPKGMENLPWEIANVDFNKEKKTVEMPFMFTSSPVQFELFSPIRMAPKKFYEPKSFRDQEMDGRALAALVRIFGDAGRPENKKVLRALEVFGKESGLFDSLEARAYDKKDSRSPIEVSIVRSGKRFTLDQVGYGVSQILPVVIAAVANVGDNSDLDDHVSVLAIQQPELHLHPRAQAAFGSLVFKLAQSGVRFVIETHSDFILDRFRIEQSKSKKKVSAAILFCENSSAGNSVSEIDIDNNGDVIDAPDSYRHFFLLEEDKLFDRI